MSTAGRNLVCGQVAFFCSLVTCYWVSGSAFGHNRGLSFYGSDDQTFVPYAFGFAALVVCLARAAVSVERAAGLKGRGLASGIRALIVVLLFDLCTPDTVDQAFYDAHIVASVVLFVFEIAFGVWLVVKLVGSLGGWLLWGAQFVGGVGAGMSQLHWLAVLGQSILVFQLAFGILLVTAAARLTPQPAQLTRTNTA